MVVTTARLGISYESDGFPVTGPVANGLGMLEFSWDDLLWAAVTVGRPNRFYVFRHGTASQYEALFRWSLVRMALEQSRPYTTRLRRTAAARALDPSEKGAVNYFLGLTICKLFAAKLLKAPWLLHLDVFRDKLEARILSGRSRPDLVGPMTNGDWVAFECKGRVSPPDAATRQRAKQQAQRLIGVGGSPPVFHIGAITYFQGETLRFYWQDPDSGPVKSPIEVETPSDHWRHYYTPVLDLIRSHGDAYQQMLREAFLLPIEGVDVEVGIHPTVLRLLGESRWSEAHSAATSEEAGGIDHGGLPYQADGIAVRAGSSWLQRFQEPL